MTPPAFTDLTPALHIVAVDEPSEERSFGGGGRYPLGAAILIGVVVLVTLIVVLTLVGGVSKRDKNNGLPFTAPTGGTPSLGTFAAPAPAAPPSVRPSPKAHTVTPSPSSRSTLASKKPSSVSAADALNGTTPPIAPGSLVGPGDRCTQVRAVGGQAELATCDGSQLQHWSQPGDGTLRVQLGCLDVRDGAVAGTPVQVTACDGTSSQRWNLRGDGTLFNAFANRCAADSGGKVALADCGFGATQNWRLEQ